jgi:hypothetical protein
MNYFDGEFVFNNDARANQQNGMKKNLTFILAISSALALASLTAAADDGMDPSKLPPAAAKTGITYATDIKPIFEKSCVKCHGADKPKAKLQLNSLEAALKGGKNGKDIIAGKSEKSPLVYSVAHVGEDEDLYMPPPDNKDKLAPLTKEQIGLIRAWIDQGAK